MRLMNFSLKGKKRIGSSSSSFSISTGMSSVMLNELLSSRVPFLEVIFLHIIIPTVKLNSSLESEVWYSFVYRRAYEIWSAWSHKCGPYMINWDLAVISIEGHFSIILGFTNGWIFFIKFIYSENFLLFERENLGFWMHMVNSWISIETEGFNPWSCFWNVGLQVWVSEFLDFNWKKPEFCSWEQCWKPKTHPPSLSWSLPGWVNLKNCTSLDQVIKVKTRAASLKYLKNIRNRKKKM